MIRSITLLGSFLLLIGCSSQPDSKSVAKNFLENLAKGQIEEAKKFAVEPLGKQLDLASSFSKPAINPDFKFNFERDSIAQNKSWVMFSDEKGNVGTVELFLIDDNWKVNDIRDKKIEDFHNNPLQFLF